ERLYRGTEEEIRERIAAYRPFLQDLPAGAPVLDLGCGRGEALALLREWGLAGRGVDASARLVELCRGRAVEAEGGYVLAALPGGRPPARGRPREAPRRPAPARRPGQPAARPAGRPAVRLPGLRDGREEAGEEAGAEAGIGGVRAWTAPPLWSFLASPVQC